MGLFQVHNCPGRNSDRLHRSLMSLPLRATNQETPRSSPLPSRSRDAVQILVPKDITDPLNLNAGEGDGVLVSPLKSRRRHRYRQHGGGGEKEAVAARLFPPSAVPSGDQQTSSWAVQRGRRPLTVLSVLQFLRLLCPAS